MHHSKANICVTLRLCARIKSKQNCQISIYYLGGYRYENEDRSNGETPPVYSQEKGVARKEVMKNFHASMQKIMELLLPLAN